MNHPRFSKSFRRACALLLAAALALPAPAFASQGTTRLETDQEILDGLNYVNTVSEHANGRVESYALELDEDSKVLPIILQSSGTVYDTAPVTWAVKRAQEMGYQVIAAVNTDFFSGATGVPAGIVIEDGVYKSEADGNPAMLVVDGEIKLCTDTHVSLTLTNQTTGQETVPHYFNKYRAATGGVYLLNHDFSTVSTRTSTSGWFVRMKLVDYDPEDEDFLLTVNSELELEVVELLHTDQALVIGEDEYILTADDSCGQGAVYHSFAVGDRVTLTTECKDKDLSDAQWAGGVGDVLVENGRVTDLTTWEDVKQEQLSTLRAPRTALGVRKDGTAVIYTVDGRQSKISVGLTMTDLAQEMVDRDCQWAVNLDGGGSTCISVWLPGQAAAAVQNSPSDGRPRSCATYLLLVTEKEGNGRPERLAFTSDDLLVLTGSAMTLPEVVVLDDGLNILDKDMGELTITSRNRLGNVEDGVYYADDEAGTDTLRLRSRKLGVTTDVEIQVIDKLTELTVTANGSAVTALTVKPEEQIQLNVTGSYWGRTALRGIQGVKFEVDENNAYVDENGVLYIAPEAESCTLTVSAGGLKKTVALNVFDRHTDVPKDHWAYESVEYCYDNGIVSGISDTLFGAENNIRRADFMLMLYAALGRPAVNVPCTFTDVSESDYYYTALAWAQSTGLMSGVGDGSCLATASITREQAFTILRQALAPLNKQRENASLTVLDVYSDKADIADYAQSPTATLASQGVIVFAKDGKLDPKAELTRVEMASLLHQLCTFTPTDDYPKAADDVPAVTPEQPAQSGQTGQTGLAQPVYIPVEALPAGSAIGQVTNAEAGLNVRASASTESAVEGKLKNGAQLLILSSSNGWYEVLFQNDAGEFQFGFVSANYVSVIALSGTVTNAEAGLNVRTGPGTQYEAASKLSNGSVVLLLDRSEGWYKILYLSSDLTLTPGYVSAGYISVLE